MGSTKLVKKNNKPKVKLRKKKKGYFAVSDVSVAQKKIEVNHLRFRGQKF